MIKDVQGTANAIAEWIKERVEMAGAKTAVVGLSGGADSALVALLALKSLGKDNVVVVKMPCKSSPSSIARANELIQAFNLRSVEVDLGAAYDSIEAQVRLGLGDGDVSPKATDKGGLRSCLRAPTLDYTAKLVNGIIVGTGNRDEDEMTRYFQKRGDGAVDISPIAKLHKSEVYQLLRFLDCPKSIIDAVPTADLWGPDSGQEDEKELGIKYPEVEWGIGVLLDAGLRAKFVNGMLPEVMFTDRQREVLKTLDRMERASRHKAEPPPVYDIREERPDLFA